MERHAVDARPVERRLDVRDAREDVRGERTGVRVEPRAAEEAFHLGVVTVIVPVRRDTVTMVVVVVIGSVLVVVPVSVFAPRAPPSAAGPAHDEAAAHERAPPAALEARA